MSTRRISNYAIPNEDAERIPQIDRTELGLIADSGRAIAVTLFVSDTDGKRIGRLDMTADKARELARDLFSLAEQVPK